jgi:hypothetical protein
VGEHPSLGRYLDLDVMGSYDKAQLVAGMIVISTWLL